MTVQELIEILSEVENKNSEVHIYVTSHRSLSGCDDETLGVSINKDVVTISGEESFYD